MGDPRDVIVYEGVGLRTAPFQTDGVTITYSAAVEGGSSAVGKAVGLAAPGVVGLAGDGQTVIGRLEKVESDGIATVQVGGFCTLPGGNAAVLTAGSRIVGDLDAGGNPGFIRTADPAVLAEVAAGRGTIIDPTVATAVIVAL